MEECLITNLEEGKDEALTDCLNSKSLKRKARKKRSKKSSDSKLKSEINDQNVNDNKKTEIEIEGVSYVVESAKRKTRKTVSPEKALNHKLAENRQKQETEVEALKLLYKTNFHVEDESLKKYSINLLFKGCLDASLQFSYTPEYPSDVPPTYALIVPWLPDKKKRELGQDLINIYSENFGDSIMYKWIDKITEFLALEIKNMKKTPNDCQEEQPPIVCQNLKVEKKKKLVPEIYEGTPIWDRSSCFSPYLAPVASEEEVRQVIEKIEDCRKVSTAWRNTYAYRYAADDGRIIEFSEDGGEPKAGKNLLRRLVHYNASNVIVFISRRFGGTKLGSDRFKHLNDAADDVLVACNYKNLENSKIKDKNTNSNTKTNINTKKAHKKKK